MFTKNFFAGFVYLLVVCLANLFASFTLLAKFKSQKVKQRVKREVVWSKESVQRGKLLSALKATQNLDEMTIKSGKIVIPNPKPSVTPESVAVVQPQAAFIVKQINSPEPLEDLFDKYSAEYGVDKGVLKRIARCESHFNQAAVNGPYGGMYQFVSGTWVSSRQQMGLEPNPNLRFNPEESIKTAAFKISREGTAAWPVCRW